MLFKKAKLEEQLTDIDVHFFHAHDEKWPLLGEAQKKKEDLLPLKAPLCWVWCAKKPTRKYTAPPHDQQKTPRSKMTQKTVESLARHQENIRQRD